MSASPPASEHPQGRWEGHGASWQLRLVGDWRHGAGALPPPPPALQQNGQRLRVEAGDLTGWDARLASLLWQALAALDRSRIELELATLPPGLARILGLALQAPAGAAPSAEPAGPATQRPWRRTLHALGQRASGSAAEARLTLELVGRVCLALGRLLRGRSAMRAADLAWQLEQTGPRSVPIVSLVSLLVGLILAYLGAAQLERFGAQAFIADLVGIGVVREVAALVTGIILAGRVGAAFAAQIGSMRAGEEVDALQTLGIDPVEHLVLPRVLALALVAPLLTAYAALVGLLVGWAVAVAIFGVAPLAYAVATLQALTLPNVVVGLLKGTVYGVLVALAGCRQGLHAGRSAQAVGDATTAAVVQSIVWMVVAASVLTVIFQKLAYW